MMQMLKKLISVVFLLSLAILVSTGWKQKGTILPESDAGILKIGISGHTLNAVAYNANSSTNPGVSYDTQIRMLKDMGLTIYRMDVFTNSSGKSVNHAKFIEILTKCRASGITVLPMIYDRCRYNGSPEDAYKEAFLQMSGFAKLYGQYLTYFELGNEMELFDKLHTSGDGRSENNYDMERVVRAEQYIRGMEDGLKSILPRALSMVNTGFLSIFWMDRMFTAAPTIDICAWHVYSEMPPLYKSKYGISNIHEYLFDRYKRPIWYTETNARSKKHLTSGQNEERSYKWRRSFTAECMADPNVKAVVYHELLDNPERGGFKRQDFEHEHYGYVKFEGYPGKDDEAAYNTWKANPDKYKNWSYKKPALDLIAEQTRISGLKSSQ